MIKLEKGNPDRLEGRVLVYSKPEQSIEECISKELLGFTKQANEEFYDSAIENARNNPFLGTFCSKDPLDIMEATGVSRDEAEYLYNSPNNPAVRKLKLLVQQKKKFDLIKIFLPLNEEKLEEAKEKADILFTGKYFSPESCLESIKVGVIIYELRYKEQMLHAQRTNQEGLSKKDDSQILQPGLKYSQVPREHFKNYISGNFVTGLVSAMEKGNTGSFRELKRKFLDFGKDSPLQREIENLCNFIGSGGFKANDEPIRRTWLDKIYAINIENFGAAAQYRDILKEMIMKRK